MFCLVVAMLSLVLQYEFQPYKLIAMNTVKVMEAWQNLLCIVVLLIQDADMFANAFVYNIAGVVLVALDIVMRAVTPLADWAVGHWDDALAHVLARVLARLEAADGEGDRPGGEVGERERSAEGARSTRPGVRGC